MNEKFLTQAIEQAFDCVHKNKGGPFGAVIVQDGKVIGRGCNSVTSANDPTAHAEVMAIRDACRNLQTFHLPDAVIYTSCEPCPMCLSAIYWAGIKTVYYGSDREDADRIGFSDKFIYDELALPSEKRSVAMIQLDVPLAKDLMKAWEEKQDKIPY